MPAATRTPDARGDLCASDADCNPLEGGCACCADRRRCAFFCFPGDCEGPTPTPLPPACGDGLVDRGEDCDDGNRYGGDGCASNCTSETTHRFVFRMNSFIVVVTSFLPNILIDLSGETTLVVGGQSAISTGTRRNGECGNRLRCSGK